MLRFSALLLLLAALSLAALPACQASQASVLSRLRDVHLAKQRAALIARSTDASSASSLLRAGRQLDCPIAANWTSSLNSTAVVELSAYEGCTLLALVIEQRTFANVLYGLDGKDGSVQWSLQVSDGKSIAAGLTGLTVSPSVPRIYIPFYNYSACTFPACFAVSAVDVAGGKPRLLWNRVFTNITDTVAILDTFTPKGGRRGEELVAVGGGGLWTTLSGGTGEVLSAIPVPPGNGPQLVADGLDGRVLFTTNNSATAYQVDAAGIWSAAGSFTWDATQDHLVSFAGSSPFEPARLPALLVAQSNTQADALLGVDVATGKVAWSASGAAILTGKWLPADAASYGYRLLAPQWSLHPLNAALNVSWALATARASNRSVLLQQTALVDLSSGTFVTTTPLLRLPTPTAYSSNVAWYGASDSVLTYVDLPDTPYASSYFAYSATLQPLSSGVLGGNYFNPLEEVQARVTGLTKEAASIVSRGGSDGQVRGARYVAAQAQVQAKRRARVQWW